MDGRVTPIISTSVDEKSKEVKNSPKNGEWQSSPNWIMLTLKQEPTDLCLNFFGSNPNIDHVHA